MADKTDKKYLILKNEIESLVKKHDQLLIDKKSLMKDVDKLERMLNIQIISNKKIIRKHNNLENKVIAIENHLNSFIRRMKLN